MSLLEALPAADALRVAARCRTRIRALRHDCWFVLLAFGVVTLGAAPLYWQSARSCVSACPAPAAPALSTAPNPGPLGNSLVYGYVASGIGRWVSAYWVAAIPLALAASVLYYRHRTRRTGLEARVWPGILAGLVLLTGLVVFSSNFLVAFHLEQLTGWFPVFTIRSRGLGPLVVFGVCIGVLAVLDRRPALGAFAGGYLTVSVLANLNMSLQPEAVRFGLPPSADQLPNIVVPGLVLVAGAFAFWWSDRRRVVSSEIAVR